MKTLVRMTDCWRWHWEVAAMASYDLKFGHTRAADGPNMVEQTDSSPSFILPSTSSLELSVLFLFFLLERRALR